MLVNSSTTEASCKEDSLKYTRDRLEEVYNQNFSCGCYSQDLTLFNSVFDGKKFSP